MSQVELHFDEKITVSDLELRWLEVADSRCPIGVQCISAGQIIAKIQVSRGVEETMLELVLRPVAEPVPEKAFGHEFRLLGIEPHPRQGSTPDRSDYVAQIEISGP